MITFSRFFTRKKKIDSPTIVGREGGKDNSARKCSQNFSPKTKQKFFLSSQKNHFFNSLLKLQTKFPWNISKFCLNLLNVYCFLLTFCKISSVNTRPLYKLFRWGFFSESSSLGTHSVALFSVSATCS